MVCVSTFFSWLAKNGYLLYNPAAKIDLPKCPRRLPRQILTAQEVERVMSLPNLSTARGIRDRTILETLYSTGMRRNEIRQMRIEDVHFEQSTVLVRGKGNTRRTVPIGESALLWIEKYMTEARPLWHPASEETTLFVNRYGKPFGFLGIADIAREYIKSAGIKHGGACHIFRHTMATLMLENGADIRYIQEILGHTSLSTTEIYTKVSIARLKEVHERTHPAKARPTKTKEILAEIKDTSQT